MDYNFPTYEEMGKEVAEKALDEFLYKGKSIREWMQIIASEDAISRQIISDYVQSHIQEINTGYGDLNKHTNEILRMIVDYIENMPPVTPQEPILDKIRAEIDMLSDSECNGTTITIYSWDGMKRKVFEILDKYKTGQTRWIPVSERLPESDEDVLVTNGIGMYIGWIDATDKVWRVDSESEYFMNDILAWMPLPEPYKSEREE